MIINLRWLLHATICLCLLIVATYATPTSSESQQKQKEPEVKAPPLRRGSMKYGDTLNKATQDNQIIATTPAGIIDPGRRRGKRIEASVKNNAVTISPPTDHSEESHQAVSRQPTRITTTHSPERRPERNESTRSQESSSDESKSENTSANWSKEGSSNESQSQHSKETTSEEQSSNASHSHNVDGQKHESLRILYENSKETNSISAAAPGSASNENSSPKQERPRRRNQSQESKAQQVFQPPKTEEHITLPTNQPGQHIPRRNNAAVPTQNQIVVQQYDIPIVQKTHETMTKPITSVVGHQRPTAISNRSRFYPEQHATRINANKQQQQQHRSNTPTFAIATAPTHPRQQHLQSTQQLASPTRTASSHPNSQDSFLSSRNANHNNLNNAPRPNAEIVAHPNSNQQHRSASHENLNTAHRHHMNGSGIQQQRNSATNVANGGGPPHIRKPSPSTSIAITTTTTPRPFFFLPNQYNIFSSEFWQFLNPFAVNQQTTTTTSAPYIPTTKRPPKKYVPPQQTSSKEEKMNYPKPKPTFQTQEPNTYNHEYVEQPTPIRKEDGPFRIALPTLNFLSPRKEPISESEKDKRDTEEGNIDELRAKFNCPRESEVRFQLFPKICKVDDDCKTWNRGEICCDIFGAKSCVTGVPKPLEEAAHSPILGLIPRKCPNRPLAELWWEVKECETDMDCWPRVCCPDGRRRYCRTSQPELNTVPVPVKRSFNYLTEYLECTAPPPRIFDLHPKACTSTLDCFPNVCCQEAGLRHCRPPKKSVLTMLANVFNVDLVKRLTQNIVIK